MTTPIPDDFTHGERIRWRRVSGLLLTEDRYAPFERVPRHSHEHARFTLVLRGGFTEQSRLQSWVATSSSLFFLPAGAPHDRVVGAAGAVTLAVRMEENWLALARELSVAPEDGAHYRGGLLTHLARRLYGEFRMRDEVSRLAIEGIVLGMVAEAARRRAREEHRAPGWLERARALMEERYAQGLTLSAVAEAVGVHPVHLARTFRRCYRSTVGDYLRQLRLDFVCQQMALGDFPLSEMALAAGFSDQSHFTRQFKRHTGMTPAAYRVLCRAR